MKNTFIEWYFNVFHLHDLFRSLADESENSPWHRERNIGVHTDMVVTQYISRMPGTWSNIQVRGAFAAVFHDVGKPVAIVNNGPKWREDRGHYKSSVGHELISARMWEDWAMTNFSFLRDEFDFSVRDITATEWMIEHHLPWDIKKADKRRMLIESVKRFTDGNPRVFTEFLLSDTYGRISDDANEKRAKSNEWVGMFLYSLGYTEVFADDNTLPTDTPVLFMPIAPSGSGKTTMFESGELTRINTNDTLIIHSMDKIRTELYDGTYEEAFLASTEDKEFSQKVRDDFIAAVKTGNNVFVDNTNLSKKRRRFYLFGLQCPNYGEFDFIFTNNGNVE
jgi:hypothetical protein